MQDTLGDKLISSLLRSLAEKPGSALDNLNRAEKPGLFDIRGRVAGCAQFAYKLIHEYMVDAEEFAIALNQAHVAVTLLVVTYNTINLFAHSRISALCG